VTAQRIDVDAVEPRHRLLDRCEVPLEHLERLGLLGLRRRRLRWGDRLRRIGLVVIHGRRA